MTIDDLKDQLLTSVFSLRDRILESSIYNKLSDRYENLSPSGQKLIIIGSILFVTGTILYFPLSNCSQSIENIGEFESKRDTIRELFRVSRDSKDAPRFANPLTIAGLQTQVDSKLQELNLLPEQIREKRVTSNSSNLVPKSLSESILVVSLAKINLHQILDLGHAFQSFSSNVKLKDIAITANREDSRYFDVIYKMITLNPPILPSTSAEPEKNKRKSKKTTEEE